MCYENRQEPFNRQTRPNKNLQLSLTAVLCGAAMCTFRIDRMDDNDGFICWYKVLFELNK